MASADRASLADEPATFSTKLLSSAMAKLIESAMVPVKSSVTVASTVRSPSARSEISSSNCKIACWFLSFICSDSIRLRRVILKLIKPSITNAAKNPATAAKVVISLNTRCPALLSPATVLSKPSNCVSKTGTSTKRAAAD